MTEILPPRSNSLTPALRHLTRQMRTSARDLTTILTFESQEQRSKSGTLVKSMPETHSRAKLLSKGETTSFKGWETTVWLTRNLIQRSEETMHFAVTFTRQDAQGQEIAIFEALWILTKDNGRWGVQARSSFAGIADGGAY